MKYGAGSILQGGVILFLLLAVIVSLSCSRSQKIEKPNIVLVVIDALRPDHLGCYGYERPTSPVIDKLAGEGVLFETAISAAPWTKTSFASFMTSLYPFQHGVAGWENVMPDSVITVAEVLRDHGYSTMAVINMLGITGRFEVLRGIDEMMPAAKYKRDAAKATDDALELMTNASGPFFIIVHYFDVHWPYRPPIRYLDLLSKGTGINPLASKGQVRKSDVDIPETETIERDKVFYDACIRYTDDCVARLIEFLEESGIRDRTVVIITADHGEAFWEHGVGSHGHSVYDEEIKVPLILNNPLVYPTHRRIETQVSLIDLVPTIVALAGAEDGQHREGRDLTRLVEEGVSRRSRGSLLPADLALCESTLRKSPDSKGIRSQDWKIMIEPATSLVRLYDLRSDPGETVNLWGRGGAVGDSLLRLVQRIPGSSMKGWRLSITCGRSEMVVGANVRLGPGQRLTRVARLVAGMGVTLEIQDDSTSLYLEAEAKRQQIVLFDTAPENADVRFDIRVSGKEVPDVVHIAGHGTKPMGAAFDLAAKDAFGIPDAFGENRLSGKPGIYVWWLPGMEEGAAREASTLTPEERERLKALGYIQ